MLTDVALRQLARDVAGGVDYPWVDAQGQVRMRCADCWAFEGQDHGAGCLIGQAQAIVQEMDKCPQP